MKKIPYVSGFDSASCLLQALVNYLQDQDFEGFGLPTFSIAKFIDFLPQKLRELFYTWFGWYESVSPKKLREIKMREIDLATVQQYSFIDPSEKIPAIAIGSSNGALTHLWSALNIPWIPQTYFIPVTKHGVHPDDPQKEMQWGIDHASDFLISNPDIQLHHMHDPNQDRLMIQKLAYFRIKRIRLGAIYEQFIKEHLAPGGILYVANCQSKWRCRKVSSRHYFQFGAHGGATENEYYQGSNRVDNFLKRQNSPFKQWNPPAANCEAPEAEWGFEASLLLDIERIAKEQGYKIVILQFQHPEDPSPLVADLYKWWYYQRGINTNRVIAESFFILDPWWTLATGSIPFWMLFNTQSSLESLKNFLQNRPGIEEVYLSLFSHGVDSIGLAPIGEWKKALDLAKKTGRFIGMDTEKFPRNFSVYSRYQEAIKETIPYRYPKPLPLSHEQLRAFIAEYPLKSNIEWLEYY